MYEPFGPAQAPYLIYNIDIGHVQTMQLLTVNS